MKTLPRSYRFLPLLGALTLPLSLAAADPAKQSADAPAPAGCSCCVVKPTEAGKTYTLRGIIQSELPERQALLVKHEEIPGFMQAMTMMFQINPERLPPVKAGDTITATMQRSDAGTWLLEDVQVIDP